MKVQTCRLLIPLGAKVSDRITRFTGIVSARAQYITGCNQYLVTPHRTDGGNYPESVWIDEDRLDVVSRSFFKKETKKETKPKIKGFGPPPPKK